MRSRLLSILLALACISLSTSRVLAFYNPLSVPNNKLGVHILAPSEISRAAQLVNSSGGDWGYVTIPIQPTDRDLPKWQEFMHQASSLHLIPIIRITTIPQGGTWDAGADTDLVDFANFLSELDWPVSNRYIILFNEVNQSAEWGGQVDPAKYTQIVKNARTIFKERSEDFFLLGPALDDALPDSKSSMSAKHFMAAMYQADPDVWSYFDGFASHSYPNPGFVQSPKKGSYPGITSYEYVFNQYHLAPKPVFITETGWDQTKLSESKLSSYWDTSWNIWNNDNRVVAVTPFLLNGGTAFPIFTLQNEDGSYTPSGQSIMSILKTIGSPELAKPKPSQLPINSTHTAPSSANSYKSGGALRKLENIFRVILGLPTKGVINLAGTDLLVEQAQTPAQWEKGLSGRDSLQGVDGMIFYFPAYHVPVFWMKDMHFPLDMIWIKDNVVVDITSNVPTPEEGKLPTYSPKQPVDTVLEVNAGWAQSHSLKPGDVLTTNN